MWSLKTSASFIIMMSHCSINIDLKNFVSGEVEFSLLFSACLCAFFFFFEAIRHGLHGLRGGASPERSVGGNALTSRVDPVARTR